jgi:2,4-dichlorophenol 6-monooxygenase
VDAQNLVWKLAAVVHGWAAESILDSYEAERRPVAQTNADQSLRNAVKLFDVWTALGADPDPSVDRTNYEAIVSSPDGRKQAARAVDEQAEHFDMIGLQLGFSYGGPGSLVIDDGSPVESPDDVVRDYLPSTRPGGRLPHAWIYRDGHRLSTLDLIGLGRFALITSSAEWASAGRVLEGEGFPLNVVLIGDDVLDRDSSWQRTAGLGSRGAIVVRPDQHVAWRGFDPDSDDRADALRRVLRHLSGRIGPGE